MSVRILTGDCRELMPAEGPFDLIFADPPYGDTALDWDRKVRGWEAVALARLKPTGSMWVFGSMRYFLAEGVPSGWKFAQDIVWEKNKGTGFQADRFKRMHEHVVHLYPLTSKWSGVYNHVLRVPSGRPLETAVRNKRGYTPHLGNLGKGGGWRDDGLRIMASVIRHKTTFRRAIHPTEKPVGLLEQLISTSCPPNGLIGDFFAGSGAAGEAAAAIGRRYVGCEIDPTMATKAANRLGSLLQFSGDAA
jgi:site-specific DNA-methyltransferase (adenine-specific)